MAPAPASFSYGHGAENRPEWLRPDRKPPFRMAGSMRPEDWERSEFER